ncbi:hypothetical protein [Streptomyces sp. ISL-94]|uniref:hypothetical protein n=1 Tax=Streptomyces sp. ISL-94 TaxID=2819190 RepID=UPI001BEB536A|nr:hypothetical protein [Streptomyces sp. ISL-94]MBT2479711.1 hypothetical protein [Streptomyces sp. ISL-94]
MPQRPPAPTAVQPVMTPEGAHHHRQKTDPARDAALQRVCAGFTTMISPQSAARLVNLLSTATYAQAA